MKFIKSVREECEEGEGKYHGCGEEYNVEKKGKGSSIIFPIILMLLEICSIGNPLGATILKKFAQKINPVTIKL